MNIWNVKEYYAKKKHNPSISDYYSSNKKIDKYKSISERAHEDIRLIKKGNKEHLKYRLRETKAKASNLHRKYALLPYSQSKSRKFDSKEFILPFPEIPQSTRYQNQLLKSYDIKNPQERNLKGQNQLMLERLHEKYFGHKKTKSKIKLTKKKTEIYSCNTKREKLLSESKFHSIDFSIIKNKQIIEYENKLRRHIDSITQTPLRFDMSSYHKVIPIKGFSNLTNIKDKCDSIISADITDTCGINNSQVNQMKNRKSEDTNNKTYTIKSIDQNKDNSALYPNTCIKSNINANGHNSIKFCCMTDRIQLKSKDFHFINYQPNRDIQIEENEPNNCMSDTIHSKSINERHDETIDSYRKLLKPKNNHFLISKDLPKDKIKTVKEKKEKKRNKYRKPIIPTKRSNNNNSTSYNGSHYNRYIDSSNVSANDTININIILKKITEKHNKRLFKSNSNSKSKSKSKEWSIDIGNDSDQFLRSNMNFHSPQSEMQKQTSAIEQFNNNQSVNYLEINLNNIQDWVKHEDVWDNIALITKITPELNMSLMPPNDTDSILSSYKRIYALGSNCNGKINHLNSFSLIINDYTKNPLSEIKKWKNAYQRVVSRWNADKILEVLNEIQFDNEMKRLQMIKTAEEIVNNSTIVFNQIIEVLKRVQNLKSTNIL